MELGRMPNCITTLDINAIRFLWKVFKIFSFGFFLRKIVEHLQLYVEIQG